MSRVREAAIDTVGLGVIYVRCGRGEVGTREVAPAEGDHGRACSSALGRQEAGALGYGGVATVARATGMAISTVRKGRDEARGGARPEDVVKVRRPASDRTKLTIRRCGPRLPAVKRLVGNFKNGGHESPKVGLLKVDPTKHADLAFKPEADVPLALLCSGGGLRNTVGHVC